MYSPKQRVIFDLANPAQNITIPVIAVSISSITRANDRVFNKIPGFYQSNRTTASSAYSATSSFVRTPVPINIGINMSIMTKYQTDMDQILSNFVPYTNPYIVLSWQVPAAFGLSPPQEIRSEVLWNDNVTLSYPTDIGASKKYLITGDTGFTIKGWLFPAVPSSSTANIYIINENFYAASEITIFADLSGTSYVYPVSTGMISDSETLSLTGNTTTGYVSSRIYNLSG